MGVKYVFIGDIEGQKDALESLQGYLDQDVKLVILGDITKGPHHKETYDLLKGLDKQGKIESLCLGNRDINELYLAIVAESIKKDDSCIVINDYCRKMIAQDSTSYAARRLRLDDPNDSEHAPHLDDPKKLELAQGKCVEILDKDDKTKKFNLFVEYHQQFTMGNSEGYQSLLSECGGNKEVLFEFYATFRELYESLLKKTKLENTIKISDNSAMLFQHADHNATIDLCETMYADLVPLNGVTFDERTIQQAQVLWQARTGSIGPGNIDPKFTVSEKKLLINKAQDLGVSTLFVAHGHKPSAGPSVHIERDKDAGFSFVKLKVDGSLANILAGPGSKTQFGAHLIVDKDSDEDECKCKLIIPSYKMDSNHILGKAYLSEEAKAILAGDKPIQTREIEIDLKTAKVTKGACSRYIDLGEDLIKASTEKSKPDGGFDSSVRNMLEGAGKEQGDNIFKDVFPLDCGLVLLRGEKRFAPIKVIITEKEYNEIFTKKLDSAVDVGASSSSDGASTSTSSSASACSATPFRSSKKRKAYNSSASESAEPLPR